MCLANSALSWRSLTCRSMFSWLRRYLEVSDRLHASAALSPGKDRPVSIEEETGYAPEPVWTLWRSEHFYTSETQSPITKSPSPYPVIISTVKETLAWSTCICKCCGLIQWRILKTSQSVWHSGQLLNLLSIANTLQVLQQTTEDACLCSFIANALWKHIIEKRSFLNLWVKCNAIG